MWSRPKPRVSTCLGTQESKKSNFYQVGFSSIGLWKHRPLLFSFERKFIMSDNFEDLFSNLFKINCESFPMHNKILYNNPYTTVIWNDGTHTVTKAKSKKSFDKETGLAECYLKKCLGSRNKIYQAIESAKDI